MTWRDRWRPIIARAIEANDAKEEAVIRRALREAWPKDQRRDGWPYKVWLDEIARQRKQRRLFPSTKVGRP